MAENDVLVVGLACPPGRLDPATAQDFATHFVLAQILEPPMACSAPGTFVPRLLRGGFRMQTSFRQGAARFEGRVDTGIRFSDGTPLGAEDVAAAIRRIVDRHVTVETRGDRVIVEAPGDLDLGPLLAGPHAHVFREGPDGPVGTGPFRLVSATPERIRLEAWEGARRKPRVRAIEFRVFPPDPGGRPTALIEALERGDVDLTMDVSRRDAKELRRARKVFLPGAGTALLWIGCDRPHFEDVRRRRAVAHAIDPYAVAATCFDNPGAFVATSMLPRAMATPNLPSVRHDPARARELLAEAGPLPSRLSMLTVWGARPYLPRPGAAAETVASQLAALGCTVETTFSSDPRDYVERIRSGEHDLVLGGWIADGPDPVEFLRAIASSDRIPGDRAEAQVAAANYGRYRDPAFDAALSSGEPLAERVRQAVRILVDQAPVVPIMHTATVVGLSRRVEGFDPEKPTIVPELADLRLA